MGIMITAGFVVATEGVEHGNGNSNSSTTGNSMKHAATTAGILVAVINTKKTKMAESQ